MYKRKKARDKEPECMYICIIPQFRVCFVNAVTHENYISRPNRDLLYERDPQLKVRWVYNLYKSITRSSCRKKNCTAAFVSTAEMFDISTDVLNMATG